MKAKRLGKKDDELQQEHLTVQQLSASVEGKAQKYIRIGPLTMVPLKGDKTLENIKKACIEHFRVDDQFFNCDVLAGERGPSYTTISQIKNWKLLHIRFIEAEGSSGSTAAKKRKENYREREPSDVLEEVQIDHNRSSLSMVAGGSESIHVESTIFAKSVPLSQLIKLGELIPPKNNVVTIELEAFDVNRKCWQDPFVVQLSVSIEKFASGGSRDAYLAKGIKGMEGKFVVKRYRPDCIEDIERLFNSTEDHTRKTVQMHTLARHFAMMFNDECPQNFGENFHYTKLFYAKLESEAITIEKYIDGAFTKYINNTGAINHKDESEAAKKAQTFAHYSYIKSGKQIMVLDLQGVGFYLCDPEIASSTLRADDSSIYFCAGNLSKTAIGTFLEQHRCNEFCRSLNLDIQ